MALMPEHKLLLIRHGQTDLNLQHGFQGHVDTELNSTGEYQAKQVSLVLDKYYPYFGLVISSDLTRAYKTAEIATRGRVNITKDASLRETCFGFWDGLTKQEIEKQWSEELKIRQDPTTKYAFIHPGTYKGYPGESYRIKTERSNQITHSLLLSSPADNPTLVVAHSGDIRALHVAYLGYDPKDMVQLAVPNAGLYVIELTGTETVVKRVTYDSIETLERRQTITQGNFQTDSPLP